MSTEFIFELDDPGDGDTTLAALNTYIANQYGQANHWSSNPALAAMYRGNAEHAQRIARRLEAVLYPEPEPPDYDGDELLQIRRQTPAVA